MTNPNSTLIAALLDRSGSMNSSVQATEHGWREPIDVQRANPGICHVSLAQFDYEYDVVYPPTDIAAVPEFVLDPRGSTALLDATGRFITELGEQLAALPEDERPGQVICLIMTDGMDNCSQHWTWAGIKHLITQQRMVYNWEFIFLGADIDAVEFGERMGVDRKFSMTYNKWDYLDNRKAFESMTALVTEARAAGKLEDGFSDADRREAMGQ